MKVSIRSKLIRSNLVLISLSLLAIFVMSTYSFKKGQIAQTKDQLLSFENLILEDVKIQRDFFAYESINPAFFNSNKSSYLDRRVQLSCKIFSSLEVLKAGPLKSDKEFYLFKKNINKYSSLFGEMVISILMKGYADNGVEGQMRFCAENLEKLNPIVNKEKLLELRSIERDYIIFHEDKYISKFNLYAAALRKTLSSSGSSPVYKKALLVLDKYIYFFVQFVHYESIIGLNHQTGLKRNIDNVINEILDYTNTIIQEEVAYEAKLIKTMDLIVAAIVIAILLFMLSTSLRVAGAISNALNSLSEHIKYFVENGSRVLTPSMQKPAFVELLKLQENFDFMEREIIDQIQNLENKVNERTQEITSQKALIEIKSKEITDSIFYAKRIQEAILPSKKEIYSFFEDSFIFYQPKDIVSGDFYWYRNISKPLSKKDHVLIAVGDCTGHGVPGALMSMIGEEQLKDAGKRSQNPGEMLEVLNHSIKEKMNQSGIENFTNDGMDIAICNIDLKNRTLTYAGANRPLWIIRGGAKELEDRFEVVKPTKVAIGGSTELSQQFETHYFQLEKGDCIYLFTDGFADQFGGEKGKKLSSKKFREVLYEINCQAMKDQETFLADFIQKWSRDCDQVDDMLVWGLRIDWW